MKTIGNITTLMLGLTGVAYAVRRHLIVVLAGLMMVLSTATTSRAEVKVVQMKISGYLCGN